MTYSNSEQFFKAKEKVALLQNDPGNEAKLKLYALFKQATTGNCNIPKPGVFDLVGKHKWNAWNQLKNMPQNEAEKKYIEFVDQLYSPENSNILEPKFNNQLKFTEIQTSIEFGNVFKIVLNRPEKLNAISGKVILSF